MHVSTWDIAWVTALLTAPVWVPLLIGVIALGYWLRRRK